MLKLLSTFPQRSHLHLSLTWIPKAAGEDLRGEATRGRALVAVSSIAIYLRC